MRRTARTDGTERPPEPDLFSQETMRSINRKASNTSSPPERERYPHHPGYYNKAPETSREAAEAMAVRAPSLRDQVKAHIAMAGTLTVHETATLMRRTVPAVQPRFSELVNMGEIVDSGLRRLNASGKRVVAWKIAPKDDPP